MKKRELVLLFVWMALVGVALALCFKTYVVDENFRVLTFTSCDSEKETCFVFRCNSGDENYPKELCRNTADGDKIYYTYIYKKKHEIASCDTTKNTCEQLVCGNNEEGCQKVICDSQTLSEEFVPVGAECSVYIPPAPVKVEEKKPEPVAEPAPVESPANTVPSDEPLPPQPQSQSIPTTPPAPQPTNNTKPDAPLYDPSIIDTSL